MYQLQSIDYLYRISTMTGLSKLVTIQADRDLHDLNDKHAFDGHNDVTGFDALQKNDGTVVWGTADLIVYTCLSDAYNVRIVCFNRA